MRPRRPRPTVTVEQLVIAASLFWVLSANLPFFRAALADRSLAEPATWGFLAALGLALAGLHSLILGLVVHRVTVRPILALLAVATAAASWFTREYGTYLDPTMLRNVLRTDVAEASELWSVGMLAHLALYAGLPLALLAQVQVERRPWRRAVLARLALLAGSAVLVAATVLATFQPLASLMRNHREVRYLVTPANLVWSTATAIALDTRTATAARRPLDPDPSMDEAPPAGRPRVLVLVVGETARAANWGLSGYARATTPELAALPVLNVAAVESCGTNTETSVPCMFAPVGRRAYDEARIRSEESLLHLLARAGVAVHWRDNQSGCKGVCDGLPQDVVASLDPPGLCEGGRCLDAGLLHGLVERLDRAQGTQVWVLHMLGNHGPAYHRRYPPAFARFRPACGEDDLRRCSREEIVNAYDNALLYTDHVLASLIHVLQTRSDRVDAAMIYVSDHGESLGEKGLYLHGVPWPIAPDEQRRVPMVMWWSDGWRDRHGLDPECIRRRAAGPVAHDHLFHTVLGLLQVRSTVHDPQWDLSAGCGRAPARSARPQRRDDLAGE